MFDITIDGIKTKASKDTTILSAAKNIGIKIPTLCNLKLEEYFLNNHVTCRICVVEVDKRDGLYPACSTACWEGMSVITNSPQLIQIRKNILELLISNHPKDCLICSKSGECELQKLTQEFRLKEVRFNGEKNQFKSEYSESIIRDPEKCIMCRRCETMCNKVQTCGVLSAINRGFHSVVSTVYGNDLDKTVCTFCGQCVSVCPVGALHEKNYTWEVMEALANPTKKVIAQVAPAVRVALGEEFGMEIGLNVEKKIVSALKKMGFDGVFDTTWAADLTIMEEATELKERLEAHILGNKDTRLPILTSCCPAWVNFIEYNFPNLLDIPSTSKSPQQMFSAVAKNIWAPKMGIKREDLIVVSIMPCLAKKYEASKIEFIKDGNRDTDISISTRELADMIRYFNIDFIETEDQEFDSPMGEYTGAGIIFGRTGGVVEAALRTAYEWIMGEELKNVDILELKKSQGLIVKKINFGEKELKIGIAHGLGNARKLLEEIEEGREKYHAIEIMACHCGCVGGGGQPFIHGKTEILDKRVEALNGIDKNCKLRKSHENLYVKKLYEEYFDAPCSQKAKDLLHTKYKKK
ncbi:NADH-dependent [FeFe] hydrogenase, group A6 [Candidatus Cetobacterium colombiensis]|uniref:NADH-dependent [FeFe] hydrogenase, group A6 n=1 Tax=Candidatus Cetobacterium colombiensis TaxID=3073100 RepID=A0ABU4W912_9FUSO|nr:NADH-dependent [FeFe] hydrogenase, group A6 [Candidatus Cetobacterium colombiensis]MDX8335645.1 NADH-dependent [FeFe] hydrogenase, group A6 [Candidatus Cetobacterium colombiensis]